MAKLDEKYIARMEDVLKTHEKPLTERKPVGCVDEKEVVLHEDMQPSISMQPDQIARRDITIQWKFTRKQARGKMNYAFTRS